MKKGKKKKEKDLTPDRTTQSLFEELVANGIIKRLVNQPLNALHLATKCVLLGADIQKCG